MKINKKYWFKAKQYGYGWYPATWQGWTVIAVYLAFIMILGFVDKHVFPTESVFAKYYSAEVLIATIPLLIICYLKGEKPRWRWGK